MQKQNRSARMALLGMALVGGACLVFATGCGQSQGTLAVGRFHPPRQTLAVTIDPLLPNAKRDPIFKRLDQMAQASEIIEAARNPFMSKLPTISAFPVDPAAGTYPPYPQPDFPSTAYNPNPKPPVTFPVYKPADAMALIGVLYHPKRPMALLEFPGNDPATRYVRPGDTFKLGGAEFKVLAIRPDAIELKEGGKLRTLTLPDIVGFGDSPVTSPAEVLDADRSGDAEVPL